MFIFLSFGVPLHRLSQDLHGRAGLRHYHHVLHDLLSGLQPPERGADREGGVEAQRAGGQTSLYLCHTLPQNSVPGRWGQRDSATLQPGNPHAPSVQQHSLLWASTCLQRGEVNNTVFYEDECTYINQSSYNKSILLLSFPKRMLNRSLIFKYKWQN